MIRKYSKYKDKVYIYNIPHIIKREKTHGECKGSHIVSIELKRLLEDRFFDITNPYDEEGVFALFSRLQEPECDNLIGGFERIYPTLIVKPWMR